MNPGPLSVQWPLGTAHCAVPPAAPPTLHFERDFNNGGWHCRYEHSTQSKCLDLGDTVRGADSVERPVRDYGGQSGGWYQPTTRAERDELHALIAERHRARFGAARGAAASAAEHADAVAHVARLARELPRDELYALVTPSGYRRRRQNGRPGPTARVEDFGGLFPFATPALYYDGFAQTNLAVATVDFRLDTDSGLFVVDGRTGVPLAIPYTNRTFSIFYNVLQDGRKVPLGRSRSSPAFDRQRHVYVGFDTDFDGNSSTVSPASNRTYPVLLCADEEARVKWSVGMGEAALAEIGAASVVVTQGPRGDNRAYMVSSDGVSAVVEAPGGVTCPAGANPLYSCSGAGACDCATGACARTCAHMRARDFHIATAPAKSSPDIAPLTHRHLQMQRLPRRRRLRPLRAGRVCRQWWHLPGRRLVRVR
jgi:hypothetical protein